jgi:uroporphyrinogen-III decarboxylase
LLDTYYLLHDHRAAVEEYLRTCDERDDRRLDAALQLPCRIFNLGDHATNEFTPPPILKKYLMPRWQKIGDRMKANNRFVHTHWDGHSRLMLPYLKETRLQGVEALTPKPMGDMTLEEIREAVGDMVVLDLIPAILFLPEYSVQEVVDFAKRVIDMFAPRLILGISDEISPRGQIEKVVAVSELVDKLCGLAD